MGIDVTKKNYFSLDYATNIHLFPVQIDPEYHGCLYFIVSGYIVFEEIIYPFIAGIALFEDFTVQKKQAIDTIKLSILRSITEWGEVDSLLSPPESIRFKEFSTFLEEYLTAVQQEYEQIQQKGVSDYAAHYGPS